MAVEIRPNLSNVPGLESLMVGISVTVTRTNIALYTVKFWDRDKTEILRGFKDNNISNFEDSYLGSKVGNPV